MILIIDKVYNVQTCTDHDLKFKKVAFLLHLAMRILLKGGARSGPTNPFPMFTFYVDYTMLQT